MKIVNFAEHTSLMSQYMSELRDVNVQGDMLRFRRNLERIGQIMAYEISRTLRYRTREVETPLGLSNCQVTDEQVVLGTIFRAGLPFHQGFLDYFDSAQNAFVSAYRKHTGPDTFDVHIEYMASPRLDGKTLVLVDPMLATGSSMDLSYRALLTKGMPACTHLCAVIASRQAVDYLERHMAGRQEVTLWVGAIDEHLNEQSYIVPGLGDAGDLAFGDKE